MRTLICNCNQTLALDAAALRGALAKTPGASTDGLDVTHTLLCRREAVSFQRAAKDTTARGDELLVACTQESRLFLELNQETEGAASLQERPIHFVNIRETAGWSQEGRQATPKIAALLAAVGTVSYRSAGRCLVIGSAEAAERAAGLLADKLDVSVLLTGTGGALAQAHARATHSGRLTRLRGWLGNFEVEWESSNPIDLDLCTRCNACVEICPEGAIGLDYQVDLNACKKHRDCVRVCDAAGAIDFNRAWCSTCAPARPSASTSRRRAICTPATTKARCSTRCSSCANSWASSTSRASSATTPRSAPTAATRRSAARPASTSARPAPSAAMPRSRARAKGRPPVAWSSTPTCAWVAAPAPRYARAAQCRSLTRARSTRAGGCAPCSPPTATPAAATPPCLSTVKPRAAAVRSAALRGLPADVLPLAVWHTASVGIDLWLAAIAQGASQVWVMVTAEEAPEYRQALQEQMAVAQAALTGLGYAGQHLRLLEVRDARDLHALDAALRCEPAQTVARPATFSVQADKRATLELAIDHLFTQAPAPTEVIALPATGSPLGTLVVDTAKCTLRWPTPPTSRNCASWKRTACSAGCVPPPARSMPSHCSRGCGWPTAARRARACVCWPRWSLTAASNAANPSARCWRSRTC